MLIILKARIEYHVMMKLIERIIISKDILNRHYLHYSDKGLGLNQS